MWRLCKLTFKVIGRTVDLEVVNKRHNALGGSGAATRAVGPLDSTNLGIGVFLNPLVKGEVYGLPINTKPTIVTKYAASEVHLNLTPDIFHKTLVARGKIDRIFAVCSTSTVCRTIYDDRDFWIAKFAIVMSPPTQTF